MVQSMSNDTEYLENCPKNRDGKSFWSNHPPPVCLYIMLNLVISTETDVVTKQMVVVTNKRPGTTHCQSLPQHGTTLARNPTICTHHRQHLYHQRHHGYLHRHNLHHQLLHRHNLHHQHLHRLRHHCIGEFSSCLLGF